MSDDLATRLSHAQTRYLLRLREAFDTLTDQLARHRADGGAEDLAALRHSVHRLAGAAGSFGFPAISDAASAADTEAKSLLAAPGDPGRLHALVDRLLAEMERAHGG